MSPGAHEDLICIHVLPHYLMGGSRQEGTTDIHVPPGRGG